MKNIVCKKGGDHLSEKVPGSEPDFHDAGGKEYFLADRLRCKKCLISWCEITGDTPEHLQMQRDTGKVVDHYPIAK